jgi:hypothetical protein
VKRRPFYFIPLLVATGYIGFIVGVGAISVSPYIARMHPESVRYQFGAFTERLFPFILYPFYPLTAFYNWTGFQPPEALSLAFAFIYLFTVSSIVTLIFRRVRSHPTHDSPTTTNVA